VAAANLGDRAMYILCAQDFGAYTGDPTADGVIIQAAIDEATTIAWRPVVLIHAGFSATATYTNASSVAVLDTRTAALFASTLRALLITATAATASTLAARDASGDLTAAVFHGSLKASAASATVTAVLKASKLWTPGGLNAGVVASTTVTVTGAALGDACIPFSSSNAGMPYLTAWVTSANTVNLLIRNWGSTPVDLVEATYGALVIKST
jgi:hypothetical protein